MADDEITSILIYTTRFIWARIWLKSFAL